MILHDNPVDSFCLLHKALTDTHTAIHDALTLGCVELADMLRAERDALSEHPSFYMP